MAKKGKYKARMIGEEEWAPIKLKHTSPVVKYMKIYLEDEEHGFPSHNPEAYNRIKKILHKAMTSAGIDEIEYDPTNRFSRWYDGTRKQPSVYHKTPHSKKKVR